MDFLSLECPMPYRWIYLDDRGEHLAIVDEVDYVWAIQWKWRACSSRNRNRPHHKIKVYATRSAKLGGRGGRNVTIFLHKEILARSGKRPPTSSHITGDHQNGYSLDCRRNNLEWATPQQNRENYNGFYAKQLRLSLLMNMPERLRIGTTKGNKK